MALNAASKKALTDLGFDVPALEKAITTTGEQDYPITLKSGAHKVGTSSFHVYDEDGHNGLIGRVKNETIAQATELGVKAIAAQAGVDYKGNDPIKLLEAVTAKLNIPASEKEKELTKDIAALRAVIVEKENSATQLSAQLNDRIEFDRDIAYFPETRAKNLGDKIYRLALKEEGITIGEHDDGGVKKIAVFKNGEVQKNTDRTLVDPKVFLEETFKSKQWIQPDAAPAGQQRKTFDTKTGNEKPANNFNHDSTYAALVAKHGSWDAKAQAEYTDAMLDAAGIKPKPAQA